MPLAVFYLPSEVQKSVVDVRYECETEEGQHYCCWSVPSALKITSLPGRAELVPGVLPDFARLL